MCVYISPEFVPFIPHPAAVLHFVKKVSVFPKLVLASSKLASILHKLALKMNLAENAPIISQSLLKLVYIHSPKHPCRLRPPP